MNIFGYRYRVLIVDDERRDWAEPMKEALADLAQERGVGNLKIHIAEDKQKAESLLARFEFHVTSLDMRLPERRGELLSVDTGIDLARSFPWVGFPKCLVFSSTLRDDQIKEKTIDAVKVLRIPSDQYAKPSGSDADSNIGTIETLTVDEWAERVVDSLLSDRRHLPDKPPYERRLTVVGAYLRFGVDALPPLLASHLQTLENNWDNKPTSDLVETAIIFIETTARLALAQSMVLCRAQGDQLELPSDNHMITCLNMLETARKRISGWNWSNYLTEETVQALQQARRERNDKAHSVEMPDHQKRWTSLRPAFQYAMDLASYWVCHPLAIDLRYSRDGWSAELLAGTAASRQRRTLPAAIDFPDDALSEGVWQNVWMLPPKYEDEPMRKPVCWGDWLRTVPQSGRQWWFPIYRQGRSTMYMDIVTGRTQAMP